MFLNWMMYMYIHVSLDNWTELDNVSVTKPPNKDIQFTFCEVSTYLHHGLAKFSLFAYIYLIYIVLVIASYLAYLIFHGLDSTLTS